MEKQIEVVSHEGCNFRASNYVWITDLAAYITDWKEMVYPYAKDQNADHFVYCVKTYSDNDDTLERVDLYCEPLTNDEFNDRVGAVVKKNNVYVGAWHKGTTY